MEVAGAACTEEEMTIEAERSGAREFPGAGKDPRGINGMPKSRGVLAQLRTPPPLPMVGVGRHSANTMSAHYKPREQPFLNDPAAYPEFSLLVKRERINHALRFGLHRHRYVWVLL